MKNITLSEKWQAPATVEHKSHNIVQGSLYYTSLYYTSLYYTSLYYYY